MRIVGVLLAGLLSVMAAACGSTPEPLRPEVVSVTTASPQSIATPATETPASTATAELPAPASTAVSTNSAPGWSLSENVATLGDVVPSSGEESARLAVDGDLGTLWNSNRMPLGWFRVALDRQYLVNGVELVIAQTPAGPTTHDVWFGDGLGRRTLYERFLNVHTEDGQRLDVVVDPPRKVREVLIRTVAGPSWIAWREVSVFGTPFAGSEEGIAAPPLQLKKIAEGLALPVQIAHAGDGSGRLFVVEQEGRIQVVRQDPAGSGGGEWSVNVAPFLDIAEGVSCCVEQGLLGVAFPPGYADKRRFYVSYTNTDGNTVVSRFTTLADPDKADPGSEEVLLTIDQPYDTHNGGRIAFGPRDGYLYVGSGDGGGPSYNDPDNHGQDPTTLLGAILRIDVESGDSTYGIPASNPFTGIEGYRDEIWAYGLRNPWGFAFDRKTGALFIPDVGNLTLEEVNYQPATSAGGENYGWRITEGNICFQQWGCTADEPCLVEHWICNAEGLTPAVAVYDHTQGCAVVGGAVYRGPGAPDLQGVFLYADFCRGQVRGLHRPDIESQDGWQSRLLIEAPFPISSIGEDEEGNVYVAGYQDGSIFLIEER